MTFFTRRGRVIGRDSLGTAGFSLLEMVVTIAIMAILAAVIAVETTPQLPASRAATIKSSLDNIASALSTFDTPSSGSGVGTYPDSLTKLIRPLTYYSNPLDVCSQTIATGSRSNWAGPYLLQNVPVTGIQVGSAVIDTKLVYVPSGSEPAQVRLKVTGVDSVVAQILENQLDSATSTSWTTGNILWSEDASGTARGTLYYSIPYSGCTS